MTISRWIRHLAVPHWWATRVFPKSSLDAIEAAIAASETRHGGELRFVVEAGLPWSALGRDRSARDRAVELFASLRVWDTAGNSGVLIYVQLVDRKVEIVADRGIDARVGPAFWQGVCRRLEAAFRDRRFAAGSLAAIDEITAALAEHFPAGTTNSNELPDRPLVI